jgi:hypothetical protein
MTRGEFLDIVATGIIKYGGNCHSWIRDKESNLEAGGHEDSFHLSGEAVDAWFRTRDNAEAFKRYCARRGFGTKWNGKPKTSKTVHVQIVPPVPKVERTENA